VDKKLVSFKVQLGPLKKKPLEKFMDEKVKDITDIEKQVTATGSIRYTTGTFSTYDEAERYRKQLEEKGFLDAFTIAMFKNDVVSLQEAMELLK
jgi:hypothetical protein